MSFFSPSYFFFLFRLFSQPTINSGRHFGFKHWLLVGLLLPATALADSASNAVELAPVKVDAIQHRHATAATSLTQKPPKDTAAAITTIDHHTLVNDNIRHVRDLSKEDTSVQVNYAPVGYYQNVSIRGFALDYASGYRVNNHTIAGEQLFAPEDKQQVQILKGLAGINAGVMAPGGVINYITKRPEDVRQLTLAVDERGSRYQAIDVGGWLTDDFGVRINVARDSEKSYIEHTDGHRHFFSIAADWNLTDSDTLQLDSNYQTSAQRSASGYQLLAGKEIPSGVNPRRSLGFQPWQKPVKIRSTNTSLRWLHDFSDHWTMQLSGSHSQSVIDDYSAFAYGCGAWSGCNNATDTERFFGADGSYDIYDFRSPDDRRRNDEARLQFNGDFNAAGFRHELTLGVEWLRRRLDSRGPWVNEYVGTTNLNQRPPVFAPSPVEPGERIERLDHRENTLFFQERLHLDPHWQLLVGARLLRLKEDVHAMDGSQQRADKETHTLPSMAVIWQPQDNISSYFSYSKGLSVGLEAPFWTSNEGDILSPRKSRQFELGASYRWHDKITFSTAIYQLRQANQFAQPDSSALGFSFVESGYQEHYGLELGASGNLTPNLELRSGISVIRARLRGTGTSDYEGHQVVNVPPVRARLTLDYQLPAVSGLHLNGGWQFAARNPATDDGHTRVPSYQVVDAGIRYQHNLGKQLLTWRLHVDNVFNKFYWRDTGSYLSDNYLFPGAPRTARLSVAVDW